VLRPKPRHGRAHPVRPRPFAKVARRANRSLLSQSEAPLLILGRCLFPSIRFQVMAGLGAAYKALLRRRVRSVEGCFQSPTPYPSMGFVPLQGPCPPVAQDASISAESLPSWQCTAEAVPAAEANRCSRGVCPMNEVDRVPRRSGAPCLTFLGFSTSKTVPRNALLGQLRRLPGRSLFRLQSGARRTQVLSLGFSLFTRRY